MVRSLALHGIDSNYWAGMERWYHRDHAPEIVRRYGPWLNRFECYLPAPAPPQAQAYRFYNWRMTEGWWSELPQTDSEGELCFTPPLVWPSVAACLIPPQATEIFVGGDSLPVEKACLRWLVLLRYPREVPVGEGEEWFCSAYAPALAQVPGIERFLSYRVIKDAGHVPGRWRPDTMPPAQQVEILWDRVAELWFETFEDWRTWVDACRASWIRPGWGTKEDDAFLGPFEGLASTFLVERPSDDFLRDLRGYVP